MRRPAVLAVRCAAAALVLTFAVAFHMQPGGVLQTSAQTYYIFSGFGGFNGFNGFGGFGGCGFSAFACTGLGGYGAYPTFAAPVYAPGSQYAAPVTQVVNASTTYAAPVAYSAPLPTGNPDITLSAGASPQPLLAGCTTVHLDAGSGLTLAQLLARISPAANVSTISIVTGSTSTGAFVYTNPNPGSPGPTPSSGVIGTGQQVVIICIVGNGTTISGSATMTTPSSSPSPSPTGP